MVRRRRGREEEGVWSQQVRDRPALGPITGTEVDAQGLAAEEQRHSPVRVAVAPLFEDLFVVENEAVLVPDAVEHQVDLEARRRFPGCRVEQERAPWDAAGRVARPERVQDMRSHVVHGPQQVGLARRVSRRTAQPPGAPRPADRRLARRPRGLPAPPPGRTPPGRTRTRRGTSERSHPGTRAGSMPHARHPQYSYDDYRGKPATKPV